MTNRYRLARAFSASNLNALLKEDALLLDGFGAHLLSVEAGVTFALNDAVKEGKIHPWHRMEMSDQVWEWLQPLLVEFAETKKEFAKTKKEVVELQRALRNCEGHRILEAASKAPKKVAAN